MKLKVKVCNISDRSSGMKFMAVCPSLPGFCVEVKDKSEMESSIKDAIRGYFCSMHSSQPDDITLDME